MDDFMCAFLRDLDKFITDIDKFITSWFAKCWNNDPPEERELLMWEDVLKEDYI